MIKLEELRALNILEEVPSLELEPVDLDRCFIIKNSNLGIYYRYSQDQYYWIENIRIRKDNYGGWTANYADSLSIEFYLDNLFNNDEMLFYLNIFKQIKTVR